MKTVYILIGAKGSGKSYIGKLIEKKTGIKFLLTEGIFIDIQNSRDISDKSFLKDGYYIVEKEIDEYLKQNEKIVIESTGAFIFFEDFLKRFQSKYNLKLIFIYTPLRLCLQRISGRDILNHIKMSDSLIKNVYKISNSLNYKYVLRINNSNQGDDKIISSFKKIL